VFRMWTKAAACAAAACAALIPLAGCGGSSHPVQMGAAAIVGSQRISSATLTDQVAGLNKAYQANPSVQKQLQYKPAQMPQLVLTWLVRFQIFDNVARSKGIQLTAADSQRGLVAASQLFQQQTGQSIPTSELALANAVPPGLLNQFGRFEATLSKLTVLYTGGKQPSSQQAQQQEQQLVNQRLTADIGAATKSLKIKINPRYGQLNATSLTISSSPNKLSRPSG
jgi:SurA N-terminal domain